MGRSATDRHVLTSSKKNISMIGNDEMGIDGT
jgi:hypothetical protein